MSDPCAILLLSAGTIDLDFRILRDMRTAIWSSYLLQEHLCRPYLGMGCHDGVSHYTRAIYENFSPSAFGQYRTLLSANRRISRRVASPQAGVVFHARLYRPAVRGQNFSDIVDLLVMMNKSQPGHYKAAGLCDIHSTSCHPDAVRALILDELGEGDYFEYLPPRANGHVWELYRRFDAMLSQYIQPGDFWGVSWSRPAMRASQ